MIVFYDFETTGFVDRHAELTAEHQPHIVQVGAIVTTNEGEKVAAFDLIAMPDGWIVPDSSTAVHGITTQSAIERGVPEKAIFRLLTNFMGRATLRIAHNDAFDSQIARIAAHRFDPEFLRYFDQMQSFCTMEATRDLCRIPPTERMVAAGITEFKSPKLSEAYRHLFGEELSGAHDAMVDIAACKRIYEHIQQKRNAA